MGLIQRQRLPGRNVRPLRLHMGCLAGRWLPIPHQPPPPSPESTQNSSADIGAARRNHATGKSDTKGAGRAPPSILRGVGGGF